MLEGYGRTITRSQPNCHADVHRVMSTATSNSEAETSLKAELPEVDVDVGVAGCVGTVGRLGWFGRGRRLHNLGVFDAVF